MNDFTNPLHPDNKVEFEDGDAVEFLIPGGDRNDIRSGIIRGKSSTHIVDFWIIQPVDKIGEWTCWCIQNTHIRKIGDNKPFLCQWKG
jgi:hypothetical protein